MVQTNMVHTKTFDVNGIELTVEFNRLSYYAMKQSDEFTRHNDGPLDDTWLYKAPGSVLTNTIVREAEPIIQAYRAKFNANFMSSVTSGGDPGDDAKLPF